MIYNFIAKITVKNKTKSKQFYLTADNDREFFKRCLDQYRLDRSNINIIERINENNMYDSKTANKPKENKQSKKKTTKIDLTQVDKLFEHVNSITEEDIKNRKLRGWTKIDFTTKEAVNDLFAQFDKIKLYYLKNGKRKNKTYILLCK